MQSAHKSVEHKEWSITRSYIQPNMSVQMIRQKREKVTNLTFMTNVTTLRYSTNIPFANKFFSNVSLFSYIKPYATLITADCKSDF